MDSAYANAPFMNGVRILGLNVISKLRQNANLRYLFEGEQKARGARRTYDGKVDFSIRGRKTLGSAIMYRMKNNRLALEALPQASTQQTLFFSVLHKMALPDFVFLMNTVKRRALNDHLLGRFIVKLDLDPTLIKSHPNFQSLRDYGVMDA